jgi:hypothetical protein
VAAAPVTDDTYWPWMRLHAIADAAGVDVGWMWSYLHNEIERRLEHVAATGDENSNGLATPVVLPGYFVSHEADRKA